MQTSIFLFDSLTMLKVCLEEEMALRNVILAHGYEAEVNDVLKKYQNNLIALGMRSSLTSRDLHFPLGTRVVNEFHYQPVVDQYVHQGASSSSALLRYTRTNTLTLSSTIF